MHKSSEKALLQILDNYGFQKIENCDKYNPLGQTWKLAENIGSGYFWSYYHNDMFGIKIHDFSFYPTCQRALISHTILQYLEKN